ncbi:MAG: deoxyribodipyrimidine photo-lyase, partial [SAR324 cluster bacterium]|nr:deoxyribodipyrimidine photo-lyase [SAR324 cluster bacterium]
MAEKINIFWFRQDLRIADNPALTHAAESGRVLAVYILDQNDQGDHGPGAASRWWLHHSLNALNESLQGQLNIFRGDPQTILQDLQEKYGSSEIFWNRCYEP